MADRAPQDEGGRHRRGGQLRFLDSPRGDRGQMGLGGAEKPAEIRAAMWRIGPESRGSRGTVGAWRMSQRRLSRLGGEAHENADRRPGIPGGSQQTLHADFAPDRRADVDPRRTGDWFSGGKRAVRTGNVLRQAPHHGRRCRRERRPSSRWRSQVGSKWFRPTRSRFRRIRTSSCR